MSEPTTPFIPSGDLARILSDAALFADKDDDFPILNRVHLESDGSRLIAFATNRFALGVAAANYVSGAGPVFTGAISLNHAKALLRIAKRPANVWIDATGDVITFAFGSGERVSIPRQIGGGELPPWRSLLQDAEWSGAVGMDMGRLSVFAKLTDAHQAQIKLTAARKPVLVTIGDRFIGCVMPVRRDDEWSLPDWVAAKSDADNQDSAVSP